MLSAIDRNPVRNQSEHLSAIAGIRIFPIGKAIKISTRLLIPGAATDHLPELDA